MKHSEFWSAVETVYGSAYGGSLTRDLVLPGIGLTCAQALEAGMSPRHVWDLLCDETDASEADRWVYREDSRHRRSAG